MRAAFIIAAFASVGFVGMMASACGSSTTPNDGGDDGSTKPDTSAKETGAKETGDQDVATDSGAGCPGLADAAAGLTFSQACLSCIGAHCCTLAQPCANDMSCKDILACEATCVASGTAAETCAMTCIKGDSGVDGSNLSTAQMEAESLDLCLAGSCSDPCSKP
jgi:hypothetical protein